MTPNLDRHITTDPKPDMLSAVSSRNRIQRDEKNVQIKVQGDQKLIFFWQLTYSQGRVKKNKNKIVENSTKKTNKHGLKTLDDA